MNEILRKIDEEIEKLHTNLFSLNTEHYKVGAIKGLRIAREIIQSSQADVTDTNVGKIKTNFDVITESPEKLAYWLKIISMARTMFYQETGEITFNDDGLINWLNLPAESEE